MKFGLETKSWNENVNKKSILQRKYKDVQTADSDTALGVYKAKFNFKRKTLIVYSHSKFGINNSTKYRDIYQETEVVFFWEFIHIC